MFKDLAPFNLYEELYPKKIHYETVTFLKLINKRMHKAKRLTVTELYTCPPTEWHRRPDRLDFYVFGIYRKFFPTIESLSRILAPLYLEFGILPDLKLLFGTQIKQYDSKVIARIAKTGLLVFSEEIR